MFSNISIPNIFWTVLNLAVLLLLLKRFLFGPVTRMMEERQKTIAHSLERAAEQDRAAGEHVAACEAQISEASAEAGRIVAESKTRAQQEYDAILRKAQADAGAMLDQGRTQLEREKAQMLDGVRANMAELVLLAAAKLAQKQADDAVSDAMVQAFLSDVGQNP